ncbi:MAG: hypothetical protein LBI45_03590 [Bacteroidales bacterium]|nr:hypothetical protein [Bacteroidales bacterium]
MCIFTNEDLGRLFKLNRGRVLFSCSPAIDIGPDLQVWACFPLSSYERKSLYDFNNVNDIRKYFAESKTSATLSFQSQLGVFEECSTCVHFEKKLCSGGCLAHLIKN